MSKKVSCTRGFGRITDPQTGVEYDVQRGNSVEVSGEIADRLKSEYSGIVVEDVEPNPKGSTDEDSAEICGTEMTDGSICERPADECNYH